MCHASVCHRAFAHSIPAAHVIPFSLPLLSQLQVLIQLLPQVLFPWGKKCLFGLSLVHLWHILLELHSFPSEYLTHFIITYSWCNYLFKNNGGFLYEVMTGWLYNFVNMLAKNPLNCTLWISELYGMSVISWRCCKKKNGKDPEEWSQWVSSTLEKFSKRSKLFNRTVQRAKHLLRKVFEMRETWVYLQAEGRSQRRLPLRLSEGKTFIQITYRRTNT